MKSKPMKMGMGMDMPKEKEAPGDDMHDSESEGHLHMLMEGHKIRQDHTKMAGVRKLAGRHKKMLQDIIGDDGEAEGETIASKAKAEYQRKFGRKPL